MSLIYGYLLALVMLLSSHGHTDLLDTLAVDDYWQIKGVTPAVAQLERDAEPDPTPEHFNDWINQLQAEDFATRDYARQELERMGPAIVPLLRPLMQSPDAEVAAVAGELVKRFSEHGQERVVRRLMAIRTLGEHHERDALGLLKSLADSKDLFVGQYARRAAAQIDGKPFVPADAGPGLAFDLSLLPADTALVAQSRGIAPEQLTVAGLVERMLAARAAAQGPMAAVAHAPNNKEIIQNASKKVLALAERVGNLQVESVTVGFTMTKDNEGWAAIIVRGHYDAGPAMSALHDLIGENAKVVPAQKTGDIPTLSLDEGRAMVLFPDNDRLVFLIASDEKSKDACQTIAAGIKAGKGTFADNKEMAELIKTIDTRSPMWMAARLTDAMSTDVFEGLKSVTLDSKSTKDGATFSFKASGPDENAVKKTVERLDAGIAGALAEVQNEAAHDPSVKPAVDFLTSLKTSAVGKNAGLTGEIKVQFLDVLLQQFSVFDEIAPEPDNIPKPGDIPPPEGPK